METIVAILAGLALAAAAGLRAFLPLLVVNIAARLGWIDLNPDLAFLGGNLALIALLVAAVSEVAADKIPFFDHLLDLVVTFIRPIAGALAGIAVFADLPAPITAAVALLFATVSFGTHVSRAQVRVGSSATTGGAANPILSTAEDAVSGTLSLLAVLVPIVAGVLFLLVAWLVWKSVRRLRRRPSMSRRDDPRGRGSEAVESPSRTRRR